MPEAQAISWADRIAEAEKAQMKFKPIELGYHNFEVEKAEVRNAKSSGVDYVNVQAKIIDGPSENGRVFRGFFPNSTKSPVPMRIFLEFFDAVGIDRSYLAEHNPSLEAICDAFVGRKFAAEVFVEEDAQMDDRTGAPRRSIQKFRPQGVASEAAPAPAQAPSAPALGGGFGSTAPAPTPPQVPETPAPSTSENPWGNVAPQRPWG